MLFHRLSVACHGHLFIRGGAHRHIRMISGTEGCPKQHPVPGGRYSPSLLIANVRLCLLHIVD
jgi:hypothetical protein